MVVQRATVRFTYEDCRSAARSGPAPQGASLAVASGSQFRGKPAAPPGGVSGPRACCSDGPFPPTACGPRMEWGKETQTFENYSDGA